MSKLEELKEMMKINDLLHKKEEEKCCKTVWIVLGVIAAVAAVAAIAYAVYRYFNPDYLEDVEDDFEDDFEDEDEDEEEEDCFVDESEEK